MVDNRSQITSSLEQGVHYVQEELTHADYKSQLSRFVGSGDMIVDLAWNIDCIDMLEWCHEHNVLYVNTSVELWDPYTGADTKPLADRTLYVRHMAIREMIRNWKDPMGATAILEHGANPGLVSHFTKMALLDIAEKLLTEFPPDIPARTEIERALSDRAFNRLAHHLGVRTIHISELDTQVIEGSRNNNHFLNTWSVEGLYEESIAPAEMGWGTHEAALPAGGHAHAAGPQNQIFLDGFGMDTYVRSRVPSQEITGMVVRHGEAFTISDSLTVWNEETAVYRPTVHYAYSPSASAWESLDEMRKNNYKLQENWSVLGDEITTGVDELGCLLMGHPFKSWWTGTILSVEEARELVPGQNATTLQVAASVLAAVCWMTENRNKGVLIPDQLPHEEIMEIAKPYLGKVISVPIDWSPMKNFQKNIILNLE